MRRRDFIAGLSLAAATPFAQAQRRATLPRVAVVDPITPVAEMNAKIGSGLVVRALFEELQRLGYVEGQNVLIERYSGEGRAVGGQNRYYPGLASDVVHRNPDLIFAMGNHLTLDFKAETTTIPIVEATTDPVAAGIVPSLPRPGGNITGVSPFFELSIWTKRLEYLREAVPTATKMGLLASHYAWETQMGTVIREATQRMKVALIGPPLEPPYDPVEYRRVLALMAQQGADALIVGDLPETFKNRRLVMDLAQEHRLPTICPYTEFVEAGGLIAYSPDMADLGRHAAQQIDLILRGANPSEMPFYQSTKLRLGINLKVARALGIEMPPAVLASADEVID